MWQVCKIVCRMRIQVHFPLISLLYITISPSDSGTFYLIISDHLAICSFFIEVNILLHKITTALILLTSPGNAISGSLTVVIFQNFLCAPRQLMVALRLDSLLGQEFLFRVVTPLPPPKN